MQCPVVKKKLNAWIDGELLPQEAEKIQHHVEECDSCRLEAEAIRSIVLSLDELPRIKAPGAVTVKSLNAFRKRIQKQRFSEWWQSLGMSFKGALCGAAMAGLLFGMVLGTGLVASTTQTTVSSSYQNLYASQEYMP